VRETERESEDRRGERGERGEQEVVSNVGLFQRGRRGKKGMDSFSCRCGAIEAEEGQREGAAHQQQGRVHIQRPGLGLGLRLAVEGAMREKPFSSLERLEECEGSCTSSVSKRSIAKALVRKTVDIGEDSSPPRAGRRSLGSDARTGRGSS
jgi:hypothetical protein